MQAADAGALAADRAGHMHEAGIVNGGADFGAGSENAAEFIGQHSRGDFHVLDGKRSPKAATFVGMRQFHDLRTMDIRKQSARLAIDVRPL